MQIDQSIFKAYDVRGIYPEQLNEQAAYNFGRAYAAFARKENQPLKVAVGCDMRLSSPSLKENLIKGLIDSGINVDDFGLVSTPSMQFVTAYYGYDGGIQVSASHNPKQWNGLKVFLKEAYQLNKDNGLLAIRDLIVNDQLPPITDKKGQLNVKEGYLADEFRELTKNIDMSKIKPLKIVIDASNAMGAVDTKEFFSHLPCSIIPMNFELDGSFPNHEADPMKPENVKDLCARVAAEGADLGIASDGDADRYFFVDEKGQNIPQSILRGMMAQIELTEQPGAKVAYDIRPGKITLDMIQKFGGQPIVTPVGVSLIKDIMIKEGAIFAGESSGHYAFKTEWGVIEAPMILLAKFLKFISEQNKPVSEIIKPYNKYFHSGEINMHLSSREEAVAKMQMLKEKYSDGKVSELDGLSVEYPDFWFNIRPSNTEPLLRLAIEGTSPEIVAEKVVEMKSILEK